LPATTDLEAFRVAAFGQIAPSQATRLRSLSSSPLDVVHKTTSSVLLNAKTIRLQSMQSTDAAPAAAAVAAPLTAGLVIGGLVGLEGIIDDALNRADSIVSSQLFSMRSHIAASVSDLNVV